MQLSRYPSLPLTRFARHVFFYDYQRILGSSLNHVPDHSVFFLLTQLPIPAAPQLGFQANEKYFGRVVFTYHTVMPSITDGNRLLVQNQ